MDSISFHNLHTLHPKFRPSAVAAWAEAQSAMPGNIHIIVVQGFRSFEQSEADYNQGRTIPGDIITDALPGESYHNYGLAFDFAMVTDGKDDYVVGPHWLLVVSIMEKYGMTWGGNFPGSFKDDPHFENKYGYNWRELLQKHRSGDFIPGTNYVNI